MGWGSHNPNLPRVVDHCLVERLHNPSQGLARSDTAEEYPNLVSILVEKSLLLVWLVFVDKRHA